MRVWTRRPRCRHPTVDNTLQVILPNDTDLVDTLARNGVDISVAEGEQQGGVASLLGNLLFPLIAFAGLFFLFRGSGSNSGGNNPMGGMGGTAPCCMRVAYAAHMPHYISVHRQATPAATPAPRALPPPAFSSG